MSRQQEVHKAVYNETTVSFTRVLSANHYDDRLVVIDLSVLVFIT
jgi:hypothetical protein